MPEKGPEPLRRDQSQEATAPTNSVAGAMPLIVKIGAATFGTVIAPVLVAVILKLVDSGAPQAATPSVNAPGAQPATDTVASSVPSDSGSPAGTSSAPVTASATTANDAPATDKFKKKKKKRIAASGDLAKSQNDAGFRPLFNGRDLTGWNAVDGKRWSVANEVLIGQDRSGNHDEQLAWIYTQKDFSDFRLRFEVRLKPSTDSGITLRTTPSSVRKNRFSIQLSSFPSSSKMFPTGMIMGLRKDANHPHTMPKTAATLRPADDWNQVEIDCRGPRLQVAINGQLIQDALLEAPPDATESNTKKYSASGCIGLQSRSGRAEFRKIEIQELDSSTEE